jgi:hypothetical protein
MRFKKKWYMGVAATAAALALGAGVSYAVWSVSGGGTGSGAASIAQSVTVIASTPTGAGASLYPGGPPGQVDLYVSNPNPYAVTITGITWGTPTSGFTTGCPNGNISVDTHAPSTVSLSVAASGASGPFVIPGVLDLSHSAPDGCQGVTFNVPVTVTGVQQ